MKKKALLTVLLIVALSLLAVFSVSAEEYPLVDNLGDPSWYTGNYELMTDKTSTVVLFDGETYTAYPAYYILKYAITASNGVVTAANISSVDYSFLKENGYNYEAGAIYKIELPDGLTTIYSGIFGLDIKEPNVTEVILPDSMTTVGAHAFRGTTNLKKVVLSKNLTTIDSYAFYQAKGLEEVIFAPDSEAELTIKDNAFVYCSALKELDLSASKIISLGSNSISECTNLEMLTLPESLETVGYCAIYKNPKMKLASAFLPVNLKTVGQHFLSGCKNINDVIYFPEDFEGFTGTYNFSSDKEYPSALTIVFLGRLEGTLPLEMVHTSSRDFTVILTKNTYADLKGKFLTAGSDGTLCYVGVTADTTDTNYFVKEGCLEIILGNSKDALSKYKTDEKGNVLYYVSNNSAKIYLCGGDNVEVLRNVRTTVAEGKHANYLTTPFTFDRDGHMNAGVHYDLTEVVSLPNCGVDGVTRNTCVLCDRVAEDIAPATGLHILSQVSPCADKCSVCLLYIQKAVQSHVLSEIYKYANGFASVGIHDTACTNEGCVYSTTEELEALFTCLGYSAPENGIGGIVVGYEVNRAAISKYTEGTKNTLSFGVFAVAKDVLGENEVFGENGATNGVLSADMSKYEHKIFEIKIVGFSTEAHKEKKLAMGAYVAETDAEGTEYSYIQDTSAGEKVGNYHFASFNEIVASANK